MPVLSRFASIVSGPLLIIALLVGAIIVFQNRLLYFPSKVALQHYAPDGLNLWPLTTTIANSDSEQSPQTLSPDKQPSVLGLIGNPENDQRQAGLAIVFHGNAGHAGHRNYYVQQLTKIGVRTLLAEYPGYGPRPGSPSEDSLISDGANIVKLAHQQYGGPVWLVGESLGAGVAAGVLKEVPSLVQGIVLITPWNRLRDVAAFHYPLLPVGWLLRSNYDSIEALHGITAPKLIIVAQNDRIVPAKLGIDLFEQISQPKRLVTLDNAGHNDWMTYVKPEFWQTTMQWLIDESGN